MNGRRQRGRGKSSTPVPARPGCADPGDTLPQDFGNALGQHLRREPALIVTAVSLAAAACGLWASYWYYRGFGIQIIDYMQVGDFLIGWLRDPVYIALVLLAIAMGWLTTWKDRFEVYRPQRVRVLRRRHAWARVLLRERGARADGFDPLGPVSGMLLGIVLFALALILWYDGRLVASIKAGDGQRVQLTRNGNTVADAQTPILLGVVSNWVFVYWVERGDAEAIPQGAVTRLTYPKQVAHTGRVQLESPARPAGSFVATPDSSH